MRTSLTLICSLALACTAGAQGESKSNQPAPKKKQVQSGGDLFKDVKERKALKQVRTKTLRSDKVSLTYTVRS
jgi:hypothetical protein